MKNFISATIIFSLIIFLNGCSYSSKQYSDWFGDKSIKKFEDLNENMWTFVENEKNYELLAVSVNSDKSIFADRDGRYVLFDGWTIKEKGGFENRSAKILVLEDNGFFLVKKNGITKYRYKCSDWIKKESNNETFFIQDCVGRYNVTNQIIVDGKGFISEITQGMTDKNNVWTLRKNKT